MSATGRKNERLGGEEDDFPTPAWCVRRLFERWRPLTSGGHWVEPGVGEGAVVAAVNAIQGAPMNWSAIDIRPTAAVTIKGDYLKLDRATILGEYTKDPVSVVITNPPYNLALEFIQHSQRLFPEAQIAMLLRVNFLATDDRAAFMQSHAPDVYVLPNRPVFRLNKQGKRATDATEYAWMIWRGTAERRLGYLSVLNTTPQEERLADEPKSRSGDAETKT